MRWVAGVLKDASLAVPCSELAVLMLRGLLLDG
jgi:hypothetical protein